MLSARIRPSCPVLRTVDLRSPIGRTTIFFAALLGFARLADEFAAGGTDRTAAFDLFDRDAAVRDFLALGEGGKTESGDMPESATMRCTVRKSGIVTRSPTRKRRGLPSGNRVGLASAIASASSPTAFSFFGNMIRANPYTVSPDRTVMLLPGRLDTIGMFVEGCPEDRGLRYRLSARIISGPPGQRTRKAIETAGRFTGLVVKMRIAFCDVNSVS